MFACMATLAASNHQAKSGYLGVGFVLVAIIVGVIIARNLPRNPIGWLMLAIPASVGAFTLCQQVTLAIDHTHPLVAATTVVLTQVFYYCFLFAAPLVLLFFPDGALPSPRWRPVLHAYLALAAGVVILTTGWEVRIMLRGSWRFDSNGDVGGGGPGPAVNLALAVLAIGCLVLALSWVARRIVGYRRASGVVRQQFKWLAVGAVCLVVALVVSFVTPSGKSTSATVENVITDLAAVPFPLTVGIAILRYRLYDIDRVISRTLSYALLSGLLGGVYAGIVTLSARTLPFSSSVAVVASTLAAAALFNPLRKRIQRLVDRRFNRARYDAEMTVAGFRSQLRDAVDLATVQRLLVNAVHEALEPTHVGLWIRQKTPERNGRA